ncbi:MAG TPA: class I SAM-dependent methyltransferase [Thermoanaerobaculia bacterium]|nr:class I SAM-dependent methyltransferase [Thermoanaerobaculia bacterium]
MTEDVGPRVASLYRSRFLQGYARGKIAGDPAYAAAFRALPDAPLLDLGCGAGVLSFYLRERGFRAPILGIDHDAKKIAAAQLAAARYHGLEFRAGDARAPLDFRGSTVMLDLLHYFTQPEQLAILRAAAARTPPGGVVVIRDALRDGSWRYRATYAQESFSRLIGWLRAERLHFPTRALIESAFQGFDGEVAPLWGRTPFNNYLFVFTRRKM